jgi:hypothetical protein
MLANFALAPWACVWGWKPAEFVVALVALMITIGAGLISWKNWRGVGIEMPGETGGVVARDRSLGLAGVLLNGMFVLVIIAQAIPNMVLRACD